jgi:hypothetical protein
LSASDNVTPVSLAIVKSFVGSGAMRYTGVISDTTFVLLFKIIMQTPPPIIRKLKPTAKPTARPITRELVFARATYIAQLSITYIVPTLWKVELLAVPQKPNSC